MTNCLLHLDHKLPSVRDLQEIRAELVRKANGDLVKDLFGAAFTVENHFEPPRYNFYYRLAHEAKFFVVNHQG